MNEIKLFDKLKNAYDITTKTNNFFKRVIDSIKWDSVFCEDDEFYYCMENGFFLVVENHNPFEERWEPCVYFSDNSCKYFRD